MHSLNLTGVVCVPISTDIAAHRIDVDNITYVINFELSNEPETDANRIGHSARAGTAGVVISIY
jgi:ATP-dependent RNA helicase RhlE